MEERRLPIDGCANEQSTIALDRDPRTGSVGDFFPPRVTKAFDRAKPRQHQESHSDAPRECFLGMAGVDMNDLVLQCETQFIIGQSVDEAR